MNEKKESEKARKIVDEMLPDYGGVELENFIIYNNICCDACKFYAGNTPVPNRVDYICGCEKMRQTGAEFVPPNIDAFGCPNFVRFLKD